ncbi:MAG: PorP/SprF family type IX secretion system membrane protein [Cyclobacteriaceae bacterium]
MRARLLFIIGITTAMMICLESSGQQVQFSQYYSASLHLNPAIAGIYLSPSFHIGYRRQVSGSQSGTGVNDRFINDLSQASFIFPVKKKRSYGMPNGGIGLLLYTNGAGPGGGIKTNGVLLNYAHNLQIGPVRGKETLIFSIQSGYEQMRLSTDGLRWGSQHNPYVRDGFDPTSPVPFLDGFTQSPGYPVINFGMMYYWNIERNFHTYRYSAFSGFTVNNINQPNNSFLGNEEGKINMFYKYHGGFEFRLKSFDFLPTILGTYANGTVRFNAGGTIAYDLQERRRFVTNNNSMKLAFGLWYKWKESFIVYGGFRSASLNIGLSYDLSTKEIIDSQILDFGPATELTLQYYFVKKSRRSRAAANPLF